MKLAARLLNFLPLKRTTAAAQPARAALPAPLILALEPRIVYDGSAAAIGAAAAPHHADVHHTDAAPPSPAAADAAARNTANSANATGSSAPQTRTDAQANPQTNPQADAQARSAHSLMDAAAATPDKQVVFIDPSVANYQQLLAGLPAGTQYVVLDSGTDGLAQIAQYLQQHPGVDAIHLISHGTDGAIQIGATWLTAADFSAYRGELAQIGAAMKPGGDFLIYGCDVAENTDGKALVQEIASVSHLNVAASTDTTGATALGGNWTLEYDAGAVHTPVIFSTAAEQQFGGSLSVTVETYDGSIGFTNSGTSFSLDGITYTSDQLSQFVDASANDGTVPLSSGTSDGALEGNANGASTATTLQMSLQNNDNMAVQSFDLDTFGGTVQLQAINASGAVVGTLAVDPSSSGVTRNSDGSYHIDLSNNAAFSGIKSLKLVETDGLSLAPTLDNFTYVDLNSPPALTATGGSTSFTEADNVASTPVAIDSGITLVDGDATTAKQATVSITGNFVAGQDALQFSNTSGTTFGDISALYDATHGVLTLTSSGTATLAQWQNALRAVTYTNTAVNPDTANRTISFTLTRDAFNSGSNTVTKVVAVHATDQTPIVTTTGGTTGYQAGAGATTIDTHVSVSDGNDATQVSATVSISGGFHAGDTLSFTNNGSTMGNITAPVYDAGTGVLTLTASGGATNAQWAAALSAVKFSSTSTALGNRTISFATNDGTRTSVAANDTVDVTNPVHVTTDAGSAAFIEADNTASIPVAVDSGLTISDAVAGTLGSATVSITGNFRAGEDILSFTNDGATMGNIAVQSYDPATGVLTLVSASGSATTAQWQSALQSVTYTDTAITPNAAARTVSFAVTDSLGNTSDAATRTVTVTATDQTPILTTTGSTTTYVAGKAPKTIDSGITLSDLDNPAQQSATVSITGNFHSGDTLGFANTSGALFGDIQASYTGAIGTLRLVSASGATNAQWANALAAVTFSSASTAVPGSRTITFSVSDGTQTSAPRTDVVSLTAPPTITTDGGSAQFISGDNAPSTPVVIDTGIVVADGSSTTFMLATVSITGNFHAGEDLLSFTNDGATMGNIAVQSYDPAAGVLTLTSASATATLAQWQNALRSITYTDSAVTPDAATRTVSFTAVDGAGNTSIAATRMIAITATDQTPIVTASSATLDYVGGAASVSIDTGLTVSDLDSTTLQSATVSIGGFQSGDQLTFINTGAITGIFNSGTGVLQLTSSGGATLAQWQSALESIQFSSSSSVSGNRTISFAVNDGAKTSTPVSRTIDVLDPPRITTDSGSASFVSGDNTVSTPVTIDSGLLLTDGAASAFQSATIAITGNFHAGEDILSFTNDGATMGNIAVQSYDPAIGVLTLVSASCSATTAQWQSALQSVTYTDTAITPDAATRTISFSAFDKAGNTSNAATRTVTITATDQTPIVATTGGIVDYVGGTTSVDVDSGLTVTDLDNTTLQSATISIGGFQSGDVLVFSNTSAITGAFDSTTGVLQLSSGSATLAQWQSALESIQFSSSSRVTGNRTISFTVNDGNKASTPVAKTVDVLGPPQITTDPGSASFVEGDNTASTPVVIDSGLALTDGASTTFGSAAVAITGNFHSGEDVLAFTNDGATMGNITASYDAATGVLTLNSASASATVAQWRNALASITYIDTAITPNTATRTISFTATDGRGVTSNSATRTVTVIATDQTPIVTTTGSTTEYVSGTTAITIDNGITVSDLDNPMLQSATVSISGGLQSGDMLSFLPSSSITGSYNSATGVLTMTATGGGATIAQWDAALQSLSFFTSSTAAGNRTISVVLNDGTKTSAAATDTVTVLGPPRIATDPGSASFIEADNVPSSPIVVDAGLTLTDGASTTFGSATVAITGNFHSGEDVLAFTNDGTTMGNITASYDAATGVLTLNSASASATLAQWRNALASITYIDTAITPNAATRTISFTATDGRGVTSNSATRTVTVIATDQTPIVTTTGSTTEYVSGTTAITIDNGITVSDLDNPMLQSATVSITGGLQSGDMLSFSPAGSITGSYNSATGVLTMTATGGGATIAQWDAALQSLSFFTSSTAAGNRTISVVLNDGTKTSAAATDTVTVLGPPRIATDPGSASFIEADNVPSSPIVVDAGLTLTDGASTTFGSATVAITGNFHAGEDVLAFTNDGATMGNITASYDTATGVLTLNSASASATVAQWRNALASITYIDTAITPNSATRTISFTATDGRGVTSNSATRTVTVTAVDQTPIVTTTGSTTEYVSGTTAITIDNGITVSDLDNPMLQSATVSISGGLQSGDMLSFLPSSSITGSYDSATGVLTMTATAGGATIAQWDAALQSLSFFTSSAAAGNRTISVVLNDGTKTSAAATDTVTVLGPPRIATDPGSASFIEADNVPSSPIVVDAGLTLTDGASTTFGSATVAITGNFHSGEDVLAFTNDGATMGNITASYDAATGVLTLNSSGASATVAQWRSALASITYIDTAITPNAAIRTISFTATDGRGVTTNSATRTVTVIATDQTPIVTSSTGTSDYRSGTDPTTIDGHIGVTDADGSQASATVSVGGGFQSGDTLAFANTDTAAFGDITASYDPAHGVLTLTSAGAATNAQWANALSAVTFATTSTSYGERTISFATSDGTKTSAAVTDTVNVTNAMVLAPDSGSAAFVQGDNAQATPVVIGSDLLLTDTNSTASPASATIAITGNFHSGEDLLTFTNSSIQAFGDITGSYNTATGVLTLSSASGSATLAQWQSALDAVTYTDTALRPNTANRTVSFSVTDKHGAASDTATRTVTVATVDQTPTVTTSADTTSYSAGSTPKTIDSGITVRDLDNNTQSFATVSIGAGFTNGDALGFANTSAARFGNITASYDAATGVLTLTSAGQTATDAQWSNALSAVTFSSAAGANGSRTIAFVINDGASSSAPANSTVAVTTAGAPGMLSSTSDNSTPPAPPDTPPDAFGEALSNKPSVLEELDDPQPVGAVPPVPTITFSDSNTHYPYIPGRTMVPPVVSLVPAELATPNPSPFDLLPALAAPAVIAVDGSGSGGGFTIDISDLDGEAFADSPDVSVSLADGKGLPAWLHYDAGKGTLSGRMPGGSPDVHVLVQVRDASGHVVRREIVLAPRGGAAGTSHMAAPHASREPMHEPMHEPTYEPAHELVREASQRVPLPAGKPSLAHQFASARAALHVARPAPAAALAAAHPAATKHDTGGRA